MIKNVILPKITRPEIKIAIGESALSMIITLRFKHGYPNQFDEKPQVV